MGKSNKEKSRDMRLRISRALRDGFVEPETLAKYTVRDVQAKITHYRMKAVMYSGLAKSIYKRYRDAGLRQKEILNKKDYYQARNNANINTKFMRYWRVVIEALRAQKRKAGE
jgi:hypothetical protein